MKTYQCRTYITRYVNSDQPEAANNTEGVNDQAPSYIG